MNAVSTEFIILISSTSLSTVAIIITIIALHINQSKIIDDMKKELSELKTEVSILSKLFGRFETDISTVNNKLDTQTQ